MMQTRFWSIRMFAAFWAILFAPLAPTLGATQETLQSLATDHLAYCGWSRLIDDQTAKYLRAIPAFARLADADEEDIALIETVLRMAVLLGEARGEITIAGVKFTPGDMTPEIEFRARVHLRDRLPEMNELLQQLIEEKGAETVQTLQIEGLEFTYLEDFPNFIWRLESGHLLAASSAEQAKKAIRVGVENAALTPDLTKNLERVRAKVSREPSSPWYFEAYLDVASILANVRALLARGNQLPPNFDQILTSLGLDGLRSLAVICDESDGTSATRTLIETDGSGKGILRLWDQRPLERADLELLPPNASFCTAFNLDLGRLWTETRRVIEILDENAAMQLDGMINISAAMLGFNLVEQVLPALGDTWIIYDAPQNGGWYVTGWVLIVESAQPDVLGNAATRTLQLIQPLLMQAGYELATGRTEYEGHPIHYLTIPGLPIPVAPAAAQIGDRVICGLSPQVVKQALHQADARLRKGCILDHPEVRRLAGDPVAKVQQFSFIDIKSSAAQGYPLMHLIRTAAMTLIAGETGVGALGELPTLAEVVDRAPCYVATGATRGGDVLYVEKGGLFVPDAMFGSMNLAAVALTLSILLPSLSRAREIAKRAVSASNLRGIGQGCQIYAHDHDGKFPPDFEAMIQSGLIVSDSLLSPRDGLPGVSYVYIEGQTAGCNARNILAYERVTGYEGTNVLFVDGRVEWMSLPEFEDALRNTYERLGRPFKAPVGDYPEMEYDEIDEE